MAIETTSWRADLASREQEHLDEFFDFLRIPSISALLAHQPDIDRAAEWTAARLRKARAPEVEILQTGGKPLVWGRWHVSNEQPTALITPTTTCNHRIRSISGSRHRSSRP